MGNENGRKPSFAEQARTAGTRESGLVEMAVAGGLAPDTLSGRKQAAEQLGQLHTIFDASGHFDVQRAAEQMGIEPERVEDMTGLMEHHGFIKKPSTNGHRE